MILTETCKTLDIIYVGELLNIILFQGTIFQSCHKLQSFTFPRCNANEGKTCGKLYIQMSNYEGSPAGATTIISNRHQHQRYV